MVLGNLSSSFLPLTSLVPLPSLTVIDSFAYKAEKGSTIKEIPAVMRASEEERQKDITLKHSNVEGLKFEGKGDGYVMFAPAHWSSLWPELK